MRRFIQLTDWDSKSVKFSVDPDRISLIGGEWPSSGDAPPLTNIHGDGINIGVLESREEVLHLINGPAAEGLTASEQASNILIKENKAQRNTIARLKKACDIALGKRIGWEIAVAQLLTEGE